MNTFSPYQSSNVINDEASEVLPVGQKIVVIGAGAFGGWSALFLQRKGYEVTLIDQWGPGNSRASSGGETRLMRCIYGINPFYTSLANRAYTLWQENEPLFGQQLLFPTGCLWFSDENADDLVKQALPVIESEGLAYDELPPETIKKKFPQINAENCHVILEKKSGYLMARAGCKAVVELFVKEGGTYIQDRVNTEKIVNGKLSEIDLQGERTIGADLFLFACGPWLKGLFSELLSSRITVSRQEVFYFGLPADRAAWYEKLPSWIDHSPPDYYYGVPGGIERGFKIAFDRRGVEVDPTNQERNPSDEEIVKARDYLSRRFIGLEDLPLIESRVCQYSDTSDGNFIFDRHSEAENVWILGGGSGHGYKHGPALGELVSEVFCGNSSVPYDLRINKN